MPVGFMFQTSVEEEVELTGVPQVFDWPVGGSKYKDAAMLSPTTRPEGKGSPLMILLIASEFGLDSNSHTPIK